MNPSPKVLYVPPENNAWGDELGAAFRDPYVASVVAAVGGLGWRVTKDQAETAHARLEAWRNPEEGDHLVLEILDVAVAIEFENTDGEYVLTDYGSQALRRWLQSFDREPPLVYVGVNTSDPLAAILKNDSRVFVRWLDRPAEYLHTPSRVHFAVHDATDLFRLRNDTKVAVAIVPSFVSNMGETIDNEVSWRARDDGPRAEQIAAQLEGAVDSSELVDHLVLELHRWRQGAPKAAQQALPAVQAGPRLVVPDLVRVAEAGEADLPELLSAVEALLGIARRVLDETSPQAWSHWVDLDSAHNSLSPQLRAPRPNIQATTALFGEIVSLLGQHDPPASPKAETILNEAGLLGSDPDPVTDAEHARVVVQELLDHAVDHIADTGSPSVISEVVERTRQGAKAGRAAAMEDLERRVQGFVAGLPGAIINGAWFSASAVAATTVQLAASDPRLAASGGLVVIILRFVLSAYRRR